MFSGGSLEAAGNSRIRQMIIHDITRLIVRLFFDEFNDLSKDSLAIGSNNWVVAGSKTIDGTEYYKQTNVGLEIPTWYGIELNGSYNYINGQKLNEGDVIYLTDTSGKRVKYVIYKKYQTDSNDFSYATRTTNGKREISVSTCTDDSSARLILWAKEG